MSDSQVSAALSSADARRRQQRAPCHAAHRRFGASRRRRGSVRTQVLLWPKPRAGAIIDLNSSGLAGGVILCARRALTRCASGIPGGRSRLVAAALRDAVADVHHRWSARPKRLRAPLRSCGPAETGRRQPSTDVNSSSRPLRPATRPPHGGRALPGLVLAELACPDVPRLIAMGRSCVPNPRRRVTRGTCRPGAGADGWPGLGTIGRTVPSAAAAPGDTPLRAPPAAVWPAAKTLDKAAHPGRGRGQWRHRWSRTTPREASTSVTEWIKSPAGCLTRLRPWPSTRIPGLPGSLRGALRGCPSRGSRRAAHSGWRPVPPPRPPTGPTAERAKQ
jgi:hypothetical protein